MTQRKYYEAFDERFKKVHAEGVLWFPQKPSPELISWLNEYQIPPGEEIGDIGCGEGRDALFLSSLGYKVTAFDISESAIKKCQELSEKNNLKVNWQVVDFLFLPENFKKYFKWLIAIGTLQIFVKDEDREKFLKNIFEILTPQGHCLLVNMGDGSEEYSENPEKAFEEQERLHLKKDGQLIKKVFLPQTTCRMVNWDYHFKEINKAGFEVEKYFVSENPIYGKSMVVYLKKPF